MPQNRTTPEFPPPPPDPLVPEPVDVDDQAVHAWKLAAIEILVAASPPVASFVRDHFRRVPGLPSLLATDPGALPEEIPWWVRKLCADAGPERLQRLADAAGAPRFIATRLQVCAAFDGAP